jgi:predicted signal transduction protein with EAL and GGDEF domain
MSERKIEFITVPKILGKIYNSDDPEEVIHYENKLACVIGSPLTLLGGVFNYLLLHSLNPRSADVIINSMIFFTFFILFEVFGRININDKVNSYIISILYTGVSAFVFIRLYAFIGPAVWTLFAIQMAFAVFRTRRDMTLILGITVAMIGVHVIFNIEDYTFPLSSQYFLTQFVLLIVLFLVFLTLQRINTNRSKKLKEKILEATEQNGEISALYEEVTATEEELRINHEKLQEREKELYEAAYFDPLTGFPNRTMFIDYLTETTENFSKNKRKLFLPMSVVS